MVAEVIWFDPAFLVGLCFYPYVVLLGGLDCADGTVSVSFGDGKVSGYHDSCIAFDNE